jgi:IclR family acetate operon transcriptional repressor
MPRLSQIKEPESSATEPTRERSGVQSIERAFAILDQIAHHEGISLADLSKKVGLHNSTVFHLVRTMVELGLARQAKDTKRYHLGRTIFRLAARSFSEVELVGIATPFLESLAAKTGESSHLALRVDSGVVIVARVAGTGAFQLVERTGGIRPAHCTALGKVLLAALPDDQLEKYLLAMDLRAWTPKTLTDIDMLRQELLRVRETGVGFDDAEFDMEVRCVAAPVHDFRGQVAGAIGISGPVWRMTLPRLLTVAEQVKQTAAEMSEELGQNNVPTTLQS